MLFDGTCKHVTFNLKWIVTSETMPQASATSSTTKNSGSGVLFAIIGGGALLLQLARGAAVLPSSRSDWQLYCSDHINTSK